MSRGGFALVEVQAPYHVGGQTYAKAGSSYCKKIQVDVPKEEYAAYKSLLMAKDISAGVKIIEGKLLKTAGRTTPCFFFLRIPGRPGSRQNPS